MQAKTNHLLSVAAAAAIGLMATVPIAAQAPDGAKEPPPASAERVPDELEGVGVTEKLGDKIPLDAAFVDHEGRSVTLDQYFNQGRPVVINLGYYSCPMLCGLVSNGVRDAMKEMSLVPGEDYDVLTVSVDPTETAQLARLKRENYLEDLDMEAAGRGWHFLVGKEEQIARLTDAVGFNFKWNPRRNEFAHAAVIIVATPDGTVSRYLYGIDFPERTLRLSLVEASQGKIGSTVDRFILTCFQYDPDERGYRVMAMGLMRLGGGLTVLILAGVIGGMFLREAIQRRKASRTEGQA